VVSVVIGRQDSKTLHIDLWLMSCRVLKRCMEEAMMDVLIKHAEQKGLEKIMGYYFKTAKNAMVSDFYANFGFVKISQERSGDSIWVLEIKDYRSRNNVIKVEN
jgi:predicted enzyme involved in methoxymalonyl-ACP biosynthesis